MGQLWLCQDLEHLGSLKSTQECSLNFPRAQYLDIRTLTHELIVKCHFFLPVVFPFLYFLVKISDQMHSRKSYFLIKIL